MCSMTPWRKGSALEVLSQRWMEPASSKEMSVGVKWVLGSNVVGHVNSATRRKPKKAKQHAAQNMRWSNKSNARERWMTLSRGAVIGNRDKREGAADLLMPRMSLCNRGVLWEAAVDIERPNCCKINRHGGWCQTTSGYQPGGEEHQRPFRGR